MSLHMAMVSIEGEHLADAPEIFERLDYRLMDKPRVVTSSEEIEVELRDPIIDRTTVKKVVYFAGGWTDILDFEMVMISEEAVWEEFSARWKTRIFCWICEGASNTYALSLYENGCKLRSVMATDGEINHNIGDPIPEEMNIDWSSAFEDDILKIAERIGAPYSYLDDEQTYHLYLLDESHMV